MRAISIRQPHCALIASGRKSLELRSWELRELGPIVICAGKQVDHEAARHFGITDMAVGCTICIVTVTKVRPFRLSDRDYQRALLSLPESVEQAAQDAALWAWELARPRRLQPRKVVGRLGIFEVDDARIRFL